MFICCLFFFVFYYFLGGASHDLLEVFQDFAFSQVEAYIQPASIPGRSFSMATRAGDLWFSALLQRCRWPRHQSRKTSWKRPIVSRRPYTDVVLVCVRKA